MSVQKRSLSRPSRVFNHQSGMTLIELLISITIGLAILAAIGSAYVTSSNLRKERDDRSEVFDSSRQVFSRLSYETGMAGYIDFTDLVSSNQTPASNIIVPGNTATMNIFIRVPTGAPLATPLTRQANGLWPVFGCEGLISSNPASTIAGTPTISMTCGTTVAGTTSQSIQFAYQVLPTTTTNTIMASLSANANTGEGLDCLQQTPGGAAPVNRFVINRYYLATNASDSTRELYCQGTGNTAGQPIARGVEEFVVRYLVAAPGTTTQASTPAGGTVASYLTATEVANTTTNPIGWAAVSAIEVCMMTATAPSSSSAATGIVQAQATRPTCARQQDGRFVDNLTRATTDQRLWRRQIRTFVLRNNVYNSPV